MNRTSLRTASLVLTLGSTLLAARAGEEAPDKSRYTLFNPTPADQLRELSPDRPDKTDSPRTVDAGHFSLEMDFFNFGRFTDDTGGVSSRSHAYQAAPMNVKVGVLNSVDLQLQLSPYTWKFDRSTPPGVTTRTSGFGDLTPRVKVNLMGNDNEGFALALMPYVKVPTGRGKFTANDVEGGLKIPYAFAVPGWEVGLQAEVDYLRDLAGTGYHPHIVNSISVGRPIYGRLGYYVEYFSDVSLEPGAGFISTFDTWFTYSVSKNLRLEAGVYIGLTKASEAIHPFIGMSFRY